MISLKPFNQSEVHLYHHNSDSESIEQDFPPMHRLLLSVLLIASLLLTSCASIKRHPVLYGMAAGAAVGVTVGIITRRANECPKTIDGYPYTGTPSGGKCPEYWPPTK